MISAFEQAMNVLDTKIFQKQLESEIRIYY